MQGKENKIFKNFAKKSNNHRMPHRILSTRNDYEQKINYDWPNPDEVIWILSNQECKNYWRF